MAATNSRNILRKWHKSQSELKCFFCDKYEDFGLVVALPDDKPCENRLIENKFLKLKEEANLQKVVFSSLRHSRTTYKLKLNHDNLKATQDNTVHAEIDTITKVYAHILDEFLKINAQKFESAFYSNPTKELSRHLLLSILQLVLASFIAHLQQSPELASELANLISAKAG